MSIKLIFSAFFKVYGTSTNQISHWYHERLKLLGQRSQNLSFRSKFLAAQFFLFTDILLKLQQQILTCFCKFSWNSGTILFFSATSDRMLYCPLLDDWKYARRGSTWYWTITM